MTMIPFLSKRVERSKGLLYRCVSINRGIEKEGVLLQQSKMMINKRGMCRWEKSKEGGRYSRDLCKIGWGQEEPGSCLPWPE